MAAIEAATLQVHVEDENGAVTPARIYLIDSAGQSHYPGGVIRYDKVRADGMAEHHFVPPRGDFIVELPAGTHRLIVERGKEYVPLQLDIRLGPSDRVTRQIRLTRWVDMASRNWFSGDMHLHRGLADLRTLMEAEDLNAALPITQWKTTAQVMEDPDLQIFLNRSDPDGSIPVSDKRFFTVLNQELESRASALLASSLRKSQVMLAYPLASYAKAVHEEEGLIDSEKVTSLELPALAALGTIDTVGLVNNHLWRSGSFHEPWGAWPDRVLGHYESTCAAYVRAGFDIYSALLNEQRIAGEAVERETRGELNRALIKAERVLIQF